MVLEGAISRAVLSTKNNDVNLFWKFILEHTKKARLCKSILSIILFFIHFSYKEACIIVIIAQNYPTNQI